MTTPIEHWQALQALPPDEREAAERAIHEQSRREALAILAPMTDAEAARYLAKRLIWRYVARGDSETELALGHMGSGNDFGHVGIIEGRRIHVSHIGPWGEGGHDCDFTFSLHAIYEAIKRELRTPTTQLSLWGNEVGA